MTKNLKYIALWLLVTLLASACSKDGADGNEVTNRNEAKKEIGIKPDVWKMTEATRATTYDNDLLVSSGFICTAYRAETDTDPYIDNKTVSYSNPNWIITGRPYYWPDYDLDFFAYAPTSGSGITTGPTYSYSGGRQVSFTCTDFPVTSVGQSSLTEFVYALAANKNQSNSAGGVELRFQHPFALINLQLAANHPDVTIHSITFQTVKNNGTYSYTGGWYPSGDAANLVWTINQIFNNNTSAQPIGISFLVIPQIWTGGVIVVNADCLFWGEKKNYPSLTTTVPTDWQPGYSYTYTFSISPDDLKVGTTSQFTEQW